MHDYFRIYRTDDRQKHKKIFTLDRFTVTNYMLLIHSNKFFAPSIHVIIYFVIYYRAVLFLL